MIQTIKRNNYFWLVHLVFWLVYIIFLTTIVGGTIGEYQKGFYATMISLISHSFLVYVHLLYLLPNFFQKGKYVQYAVGLLLTLILFSILRITILWPIAVHWYPSLQKVMNPNIYTASMVGGIFILMISIPLQLVRNTIKKEELEIALKNQQLEAELQFLKAQVNPHFLFNTLNNIYSLAFTKSDETPEMILKLSDMMSYMLYDCKAEQVYLSQEIEYLNNYIALQQLKKKGAYNIKFKIEGIPEKVKICPMLFTPFFENAFKHGNLENIDSGWIKSTFIIKDNTQIQFHISNTIGKKKVQEKGGVGLENIRQRLNMLYPNQHQLVIENKGNIYHIDLSLNL